MVKNYEELTEDEAKSISLHTGQYLGATAIGEVNPLYLDSPYNIHNKPVELINHLAVRVAELKEGCDQQYPVTMLRVGVGSKFGDVARYLETREFKNAWYANDSAEAFAAEMQEQYGPYDSVSEFLLLIDTDNFDEDGVVQLMAQTRIHGGSVELNKTIMDMPTVWGVPLDEALSKMKNCGQEVCAAFGGVGNPETTWDSSSICVAEKYRNGDTLNLLSHELYKLSLERGMSSITGIFVTSYFKLYQFRGIPFRPIGPPMVHLGAESIPAILHIPEAEMAKNSTNPRSKDSYAKMAFGTNLPLHHIFSV